MNCNACGIELPWTMGRPTCSNCASYAAKSVKQADQVVNTKYFKQEYPENIGPEDKFFVKGELVQQLELPLAATPQPSPEVGKENVTDGVIADLKARSNFGMQKYGTRLMTHNGRDALVDAYQEALDLCCYLKQLMLERGA